MSAYLTSPWLTCFVPRPQASIRLFCMPHGGGGAQNFKEWAEKLPEFIEVIALSYPGRGSRHAEPAIHSMAELADEIFNAIMPHLDKPYALFGHSVGALVAYELTLRIVNAQQMLPMRLMISAHDIPEESHADEPMYRLSDTDLLAKIGDLGLVPDEALQNPELVRFILPPLRADFEVSETYQWQPTLPIDVPITAMLGKADPLLDVSDMQRWQQYTSQSFSFKSYEGDHFYTVSKQAQLLSDIATQLQQDLEIYPRSIMIGEDTDYPHKCLHVLFREQAKQHPDNIAVVDPNHSLTFKALDEQTDLLARELQRRGVVVDSIVSIYMQSSVEYVIAYLAILKAGGAYMPLETAYPTELLEKALNKTQSIAILTTSDLAPQLPEQWRDSEHTFMLDGDWQTQLRLKIQNKQLPKLDAHNAIPTLDSLAYCVMSSGTTGEPKGIICPHRGAVNSYYWRYRHHPYESGEREATNVFFVWEVIRPLLQGYPAYIIPDSMIYDPWKLVDYLEANEITRVLFTPSLLEQVLNTPDLALTERLSKLNIVWLNGEVVPTSLVKRFFDVLPTTKLLNDYSISETHDVCTHDLSKLNTTYSPKFAPLGKPMSNVQIYLLDDSLQPVPQGIGGEIYVGGDSLARGYLGDPIKTAERFLTNPFKDNGSLLFRTGDMGRVLPNGDLEVTGRVEFMIKLRGYTIVLGAVEAAINAHHAVNSSTVITKDSKETNQPEALIAYVVSSGAITEDELIISLRHELKAHLPHYAIPSYFKVIDALPLHPVTGKLDRKKLPEPASVMASSTINPSSSNNGLTATQRCLMQAWEEALNVRPRMSDNFFDLGGHSLLAIQVCRTISKQLDTPVSVIDIFENPSIALLAEAISKRTDRTNGELADGFNTRLTPESDREVKTINPADTPQDIAIVGMAARFPGADNIDEFWDNLRNGVCSIRELSDDELDANGVPQSVYSDDNYRKVGAILDNVDHFDPRFWQLSKKEAEIMDPQHRLFLETCWHALEHAGYAPNQEGQRTGVFGGCYSPLYLLHNLAGGGFMDATDPIGYHMTETGNDKDYITTRVSYLLNLQGPSIAVQSSCSTALTVVTSACESLQLQHCDVALAGAASITFPQAGYQYVEGHINSKDGKVRTFDAKASGTILGDGVGVVVLKRLQDAIDANDTIYAVIKGYANNNDGHHKTGYSAPSVQGQKAVVTKALNAANVGADSISYVEAHGTGTLIGDPIETQALSDVFRQYSRDKNACALGSVKPNIGHSNIAAGMASLMKVALSLHFKQIPPTLNFETPNPLINLEDSPFYINTKLIEWPSTADAPRRAGVTCLGIGGTNNHFILQEAPSIDSDKQTASNTTTQTTDTRQHHLLVVSGKTAEALHRNQLNLADYLDRQRSDTNKPSLNDIEYTLQQGRCHFDYRAAVSCTKVSDAVSQLRLAAQQQAVPHSPLSDSQAVSAIKTVFLFPGQGSQHQQMGFDLYQKEPVFKQHFDSCSDILQSLLGVDIRQLLFADVGSPQAEDTFKYAYYIQPAIVAHQIALARTLIDWGVEPDAVVGHSIGEFTAAYIAGIFSLEDILTLIVARGRAMEQAGEGRMLSVSLSAEAAQQWLSDAYDFAPQVSLGVINTANSVVFSGEVDAIDRLQRALQDKDVATQTVNVRQAFHSAMMQAPSQALVDAVKPLKRRTPKIPIMSNVSGTWLTDSQVHDDSYWAQHMRGTVNFASNITELLKHAPSTLIEIGASTILTKSLRTFTTHIAEEDRPLVVPCARHPRDTSITDSQALDTVIGKLWTAGRHIDWHAYRGASNSKNLRRIGLPGYAFEPERYWVNKGAITQTNNASTLTDAHSMISDLSKRSYIPSWSRSIFPTANQELQDQHWLIIGSDTSPSIQRLKTYLTNSLINANANVNVVDPIQSRLDSCAAYASYFNQLSSHQQFPNRILYLDGLSHDPDDSKVGFTESSGSDALSSETLSSETLSSDALSSEALKSQLRDSYYAVLSFAQGLAAQDNLDPVSLWLVTDGVFQVNEEGLNPAKSTLLGPAIVLPQEYPQIACRTIDIRKHDINKPAIMQRLFNDISVDNPDSDPFIALRGCKRWVKRYEAVELPRLDQDQTALKMSGTYLITGGLGRIGRKLSEHLTHYHANIILTTTRDFPTKAEWSSLTKSNNNSNSANNTTSDCKLMDTIEHLQQLEQAGAVVEVVTVKLHQLQAVQALIDDIVCKFGALDGVFHLAGLADLRYLPDIDSDISEKEFEPKIAGLLNISQALNKTKTRHDIAPDFVMLFSSLASILGGYSMTAYTAANRFMDAYVQANPWRHGIRWYCVNWDDWDFDYSKEQTSAYEQTVAQFAMPIADGIETIERLLTTPEPQQWLISTRSLAPRVAQWLHQNNSSIEDQQAAGGDTSKTHDSQDDILSLILVIYRDVLSAPDYASDDNFFNAGGDSLLASQILLKLRRELGENSQQLTLASIFDYPSPLALSRSLQ